LREAVEMMELVNGGLEGDEALTIVISIHHLNRLPQLPQPARPRINPKIKNKPLPPQPPQPLDARTGHEVWGKVRGFRYLVQDKVAGTMLGDGFVEGLRSAHPARLAQAPTAQSPDRASCRARRDPRLGWVCRGRARTGHEVWGKVRGFRYLVQDKVAGTMLGDGFVAGTGAHGTIPRQSVLSCET
jgi:hypothetical protein